jgi:hypothetical protein
MILRTTVSLRIQLRITESSAGCARVVEAKESAMRSVLESDVTGEYEFIGMDVIYKALNRRDAVL